MSVKARKPVGKLSPSAAYKNACVALEEREPEHYIGVKRYVRSLRSECAETRVKLREQREENSRLRAELLRLKGDQPHGTEV